jgi:aminopeptidase N
MQAANGTATSVASVPKTDVLAGKEVQPSAPQEKFRRDYRQPDYLIDQVYLTFVLGEETTTVKSKLHVKPNHNNSNGSTPALVLHGRKDVSLKSVHVNGESWAANNLMRNDKELAIQAVPNGAFELDIEVEVKPQENTSLEGLYKSSGNFCTQCEAEGFRGITYFPDRPDVMAKYTTRIEADKSKYPVLLSNGNLLESGNLADGRHYAVWEDPFVKPCYLFALVAGDLAYKEDTFRTMSGRDIKLRIFVEHKNISKVDFAMRSLKNAMKWDEDTFGLEYDLDLFNIVAVDDFNMGAMENKSLNIFNSRLVLASPATATDLDFARIEGVVGHEYFHNWTGNRVTCRDWFQLTLKEGLTVFRDQEFSSDMNSRAVKRIEDVVRLRTAQFQEDAGPIAHPIRPESYIKMDNFYTVTVYEKGAEIIRIYQTLLGKQGFRKGMDLYFKRHDGQAVTCDDFLAAMADANGQDLSSVATWYSQAGTPKLTVQTTYDSSAKTYTLKLHQTTPATPGQSSKKPVMIPVAMGLLSQDGTEFPLRLKGSDKDLGTNTVLRLDQESAEYTFTGIDSEPVPSLLRGFSAPVKMEVEGQSEEDLSVLLAHDTDEFNRWEAGQRLAKKLLVNLYESAINSSKGSTVEERIQSAGGVSTSLMEAFRRVLSDASLDGAFASAAITLPDSSELLEQVPDADPVVLHQVRSYVVKELAAQLRPELEAAVQRNDSQPGEQYSPDAKSAARRDIKNKALRYLSALKDPQITQQILTRYREASNMTDQMAALAALNDVEGKERQDALAEFYKQWQEEPLVILKWIGIQAVSNIPGNVAAVKKLLEHPAVHLTNPNTCYSLFLGFARSPVNFHAADGSGYQFLGDAVLKVDQINHQVAARMVSAFSTWRQLDAKRQDLMKQQLKRIADTDGISENVYEIASKSLA